MTQLFTNPAPQRLTPADISHVAAQHDLTPAHIAAIAEVEGNGAGYLVTGQPKILFEAHHFSRLTGHRFDATHPAISSPKWNRALYRGGAKEYLRLEAAMQLDETVALSAASWGLFQVLGSNHKAAGFASVQDFVRAHVEGGEGAHLSAAVAFMAANGLVDKLRRGDWSGFARGYNGPGFKAQQYDKRLHQAFVRAGGK